jgi:uncharacterized surface protein with fasciclin (FAS1) repeats
MQNAVIIGVLAVVLVGGAIYFSSTTNTPAPMNNTVETATQNNTMTDEQSEMDTEVVTVETEQDIVATAVNTPSLSTLVTAVTEAELVATLQSEGPFTVFAPTNAAFEALPDGTLETLLDPANQTRLQDILTYHVVPGAVMSGDLTDGMVVETVNGETITINVDNAGVTINGSAAVTAADIETTNGVVHVIDSVLLPESE